MHLKRSLEFYETLEMVLRDHLKENEVVLTRQKGRLPEMVAKIKAESAGEYFVYETNEEVGAKEDNILFEKTFDKLGEKLYSIHVKMALQIFVCALGI